MGWGIEFKTKIYLHKEEYNENIYQVKDKIEELEDDINYEKDLLKMYSSCNIKDIIPNEWNEEPLIWLHNQVEESLESISINSIHIYKLTLYKEFLEDDFRNSGEEK